MLLAAGSTGLYAAIAIPAGDPTAPLFVPGTIVLLVGAWLLHRFPRMLWVIAAAGPIAIAYSALDPFRLLHADSFIDFVPTVTGLVAAALATIAAIAAVLDRRRGRTPGASRRERVALAIGAVALVGLAAFSALATFRRPTTVALPDGESAVLISAGRDRWVPAESTLPSRGVVKVLVRNADWIAHTFAVPDLGVDVYVAPHRERVVTVQAASGRTYRFECTVTGHEGMISSLQTP